MDESSNESNSLENTKCLLTEHLKVKLNKMKINRELKSILVLQRRTPNKFKRFSIRNEVDNGEPEIRVSSVFLHNIRVKTTLGTDFYLEEGNRWHGYYKPTTNHYESGEDVYSTWDKRERVFLLYDYLEGFHTDENGNIVYDFQTTNTFDFYQGEEWKKIKSKTFGVHFINIQSGVCSCKGYYYRKKCSHQQQAKKELSIRVEKLKMKKVLFSYFDKTIANDIFFNYYGICE